MFRLQHINSEDLKPAYGSAKQLKHTNYKVRRKIWMHMKKKVILPFEENPQSVMYHNFMLGIIEGNAKEDITPWLCGKYINCSFEINNINQFKISVKDNWLENDRLLIRQYMDFIHEMYNYYFSVNYKNLLRKMLNLGLYPHGNYNEKFIEGKKAYKKYYFYHDFVLYGYDDSKEIFYSAGYLADGFFQKYTIPYENMTQAVESIRLQRAFFYFWRYNKDFKYTLDLVRVEAELSDYLNSSMEGQESTDKLSFGFNAIEDLSNHFIKTSSEDGFIDLRYTRGFMEHKKIFLKRIKYLIEKGILNDTEFLIHAENAYKLAQTIHMKGIKYSVAKNKSDAFNIKDLILETNEIEKVYLTKVFKQIKNYREREVL